jgi:hypothetical protein
MSECVITTSKSDRVRDYFKHQYESLDRSTEQNLRSIFSDDLIYHMGDRVVSLDELAVIAERIRRSPRSVRSVVATDFREQDDRLFFHMSLRALDPDTGRRIEMESDHEWRFDESDLVAEVWPKDSEAAAQMFEAMGEDA